MRRDANAGADFRSSSPGIAWNQSVSMSHQEMRSSTPPSSSSSSLLFFFFFFFLRRAIVCARARAREAGEGTPARGDFFFMKGLCSFETMPPTPVSTGFLKMMRKSYLSAVGSNWAESASCG